MLPKDCPLSETQFAIAKLLADGCTPRQVARRLSISRQTVYNRVYAACTVLGIEGGSRQLVACLGARGWVGWEPPVETATPLALEHPFLAAYLQEFERSRWPHSPDSRTELGMKLALAGHRNQMRT